jgi:hypothetical protein
LKQGAGNAMTSQPRIESYAAFWPYYLSQHTKPATRGWHIAGTVMASLLLFAALIALDARLLLAAAIVGYGPAWLAHGLIEKNHPATFRYPLWSLISDYRMAGIVLTGGRLSAAD